MEKKIITFSANEQQLIKTGGINCYASNIVAYIEAQFDLGANWHGFDSVRAVWYTGYVKGISTVLDSNGKCIVPYEVLTHKGDVMVNLVGSISDGETLTDRLTTCPVTAVAIKCNARIDADNSKSITPSEYEQFVATVKADADRAEAGADEAEQSAQSAGESATASANSASDSAQSATASAQSAQNASESAISAETAKDDAEDARDKILGMRATAETLEAGSDATASYDNGLLTLGIPRGDKGERGIQGETGATPNFSIGEVDTLEPNESATATITGTAENPVLNLGIPKGEQGDVSQAQLDAAVSDLKSNLNALENGSINYTEGYGITTNGTVVATESVCLSDYIPAEGSTGYVTASSALTPSPRSNLNIIEYSEDKAFVDYWGANPTKSFTTSARTRYIRFSFDDGFEATVTKYATSEIIYKATQTESLNERIDSRAETVVQATDWDNIIPSSRHDPNTNYIDHEKVTSGYINENGVYTPYNTLKCTDFIPLEAGKTYYRGIGVYSGKYYGFYDENHNVVASGSTLGGLSQSFVVPNGAKYGRFTILGDASSSQTWIFTQNGAPESYRTEYYFGDKMSGAVRTAVEDDANPTEYKGMDIQAFDTCVCIGDSLTEGIFNYDNNGDTGYDSIPSVSYPSALKRMTGIDVTNMGASGYTSLEWYNSHQSADLSGHKFAIVQFGVNDVIRYGQGWTQDSEDGYTGIINKLKTDNQNIKIFVSTVMPAVSYPPSNYVTYNAGLKSFIESLNDANVILLDLATYGNTEPTQYNAGHLSAYGYWRLAKDYANYISWYMRNNGMQFREIQFIGTDKHYT